MLNVYILSFFYSFVLLRSLHQMYIGVANVNRFTFVLSMMIPKSRRTWFLWLISLNTSSMSEQKKTSGIVILPNVSLHCKILEFEREKKARVAEHCNIVKGYRKEKKKYALHWQKLDTVPDIIRTLNFHIRKCM